MLDVRKKALGLTDLAMYDIYAPLAKETHGEYSYEQSMELVKKGLSVLGEEYGNLLQEAQDTGWIDVYETPGKTSGAYSWGVFGVHPYVLLNHRGDLDSVFSPSRTSFVTPCTPTIPTKTSLRQRRVTKFSWRKSQAR